MEKIEIFPPIFSSYKNFPRVKFWYNLLANAYCRCWKFKQNRNSQLWEKSKKSKFAFSYGRQPCIYLDPLKWSQTYRLLYKKLSSYRKTRHYYMWLWKFYVLCQWFFKSKSASFWWYIVLLQFILHYVFLQERVFSFVCWFFFCVRNITEKVIDGFWCSFQFRWPVRQRKRVIRIVCTSGYVVCAGKWQCCYFWAALILWLWKCGRTNTINATAYTMHCKWCSLNCLNFGRNI